MFAFVSAFPKSLHCTDEAQQAETVLSAVLSNNNNNNEGSKSRGKIYTKHHSHSTPTGAESDSNPTASSA